jgi:Ca2+-transporting ATPase
VIEFTAVQTAEAALTVESLPVMKETAPIAEEIARGDGHNMVFSSTAATYGHGITVVTATDMQSKWGALPDS